MPKKRSDGEGMVRKRADGSWQARTPRDAQGKRKTKICGTQREALEWLKEVLVAQSQGVNVTAKQPTIEQFSVTWLEQVVKRTRKESTLASYTYVLRHYVLPHIGTMHVDKLTTARVQQLVNDLVDAGLSALTVRNAYLRLRGMLRTAVRYRLVSVNAATDIELPRIKKNQHPLTLEDALLLYQALQEERNALLFTFYVHLGFRRGEGLGLLWRDFDANAGTIKITQQVQDVSGRVKVTSPKTPTSTRTIPITPRMVVALQSQWEFQQSERRKLGVKWKEHGLIFTTEKGTPIGPRNLARQFASVVERLGLAGVHLHTLRHTCATLLGELGTEERVIGAILGHTTKNVTAHYAKSTIPMMRTAIEQLETALLKKAA